MSPDSFSTRTVKKTMINCLPPAAYRTLTRTYISPTVKSIENFGTPKGYEPKKIINAIIIQRVPHLGPVIVKRETWAEEGDPCAVSRRRGKVFIQRVINSLSSKRNEG